MHTLKGHIVPKASVPMVESHPELVSSLDKTNTFDPRTSLPVSTIYSWRCVEGHAFPMSLYNYAKGSKCPVCLGRLIVSGINDLVTKHPEIALEWDHKKNTVGPDMVSAGSKSNAYWICQRGHNYSSLIVQRVKKNVGCPVCLHKQLLVGFNDIATVYPELLPEWDAEENDRLPSETLARNIQSYHWKCSQGHKYTAKLFNRAKLGTGCGICKGNSLGTGYNDLKTKYPEIAHQWDSSKNEVDSSKVSCKSNKKYWWICPKNHSYQETPNHRTEESVNIGCPYCSNKRVLAGFNDVATTHPYALEYWDSGLNTTTLSEVVRGSNKELFWTCPQGHTVKSTVKSFLYRNPSSLCTTCSGKAILAGLNDLETTHPDLMTGGWNGSQSHWDYAKNLVEPSELSHGSARLVWWRCSKDHSWEARVSDRTRVNGTDCPDCSKQKSKAEEEIVAHLESETGLRIVSRDRSVIRPYELDIFIPDKKYAIEFNGLYWHTETRLGRKYHKMKHDLAESRGISLLNIWEDDWKNNKKLVLDMIDHKLGMSSKDKIYARKTLIDSNVSTAESKSFMDAYHIQGFVGSSYKIGLRSHDGSLVALMLLKRNSNILGLERYATSIRVVGGQSKILSYVDQNIDYEKMITFADLSVSDGSLYENTGWDFDKLLPPDYSYMYKNKRHHKFLFRKKRFQTDPHLVFDPDMTEAELAKLNGIERIYDCGKIRYVRYRI